MFEVQGKCRETLVKNTVIAVLNTPNSNHRIYTAEALKNLPKGVPVTMGIPDIEDDQVQNIIGEASNIRIEGNLLLADISLSFQITENISFAISGEGDLVAGGSPYIKSEEDQTVIDYTLKSVSCLPPDKNAFIPKPAEKSGE